MATKKKSTAEQTVGPIGLAERLSDKLLGQDEAIKEIIPYIDTYHAGLNPEGRPAGIFILLGPTGVGKTKTVELLAQELHGNRKALLTIHCGEFQMEHEVAKLIGAPPGYLGHRETVPVLSNQALGVIRSDHSSLSIVLFDEIEKAAHSMRRILLGILDKGVTRLGDNSTVNFENSVIFMTSNLGAQDISKFFKNRLGFNVTESLERREQDIKSLSDKALKKEFSPEFLNRLDAKITYRPLTKEDIRDIVDREIDAVQELIFQRLGDVGFILSVAYEARDLIQEKGFSEEYGARNIKRYIQKYILQPASAMFNEKKIKPGQVLKVDVVGKELKLGV